MRRLDPLPPELLDTVSRVYGGSTYDAVIRAFSQPRKTSLRVNSLKCSPDRVRQMPEVNHIMYSPIPWSSSVFVLDTEHAKRLTELQEYHDGLFYVQNVSSMLPPIILGPTPGSKVLDITAAPGSKTTQMAAMMDNSGELVANDRSPIRLEKLKANIRIQGIKNVTVTRSVAQKIWMKYPEYFDFVLADVPCSMEGRIQVHLPKTYASWSPNKVKDLSRQQRWILRSAVSSAAVGGSIVYATCTISPLENESVIDWLLKKEKGAVSVEPLNAKAIPFAAAVREWDGKVFDPQISSTARIIPTDVYEGFFIAKLRKIKSTVRSVH